MRIVFFGSPAAALPSLTALLDAGHEIALVVTQPDKPAGRGRKLTPSAVKSLALERGLPVLEPVRIRTDAVAGERIRAAAADVHVVVAYGQIIPHDVHFSPRYHSVNVHFSLLPRYRGAAPVQWTVLNGDAETGVTLIELNDRMDEGDILAQERVPVESRETSAALEVRLAVIGARLLLATLDRLDVLPRINQEEARATLAPKIRKEDGRIVWTDPAPSIDRKVLALSDRPGVFTLAKGRRVNILRGRAIGSPEGYWPVLRHDSREIPRLVRGADSLAKAKAAQPGTVVWIDKPGLEIVCGDGAVYLVEELQPEGKAPMPAYAFSLGARISPGDILGI